MIKKYKAINKFLNELINKGIKIYADDEKEKEELINAFAYFSSGHPLVLKLIPLNDLESTLSYPRSFFSFRKENSDLYVKELNQLKEKEIDYVLKCLSSAYDRHVAAQSLINLYILAHDLGYDKLKLKIEKSLKNLISLKITDERELRIFELIKFENLRYIMILESSFSDSEFNQLLKINNYKIFEPYKSLFFKLGIFEIRRNFYYGMLLRKLKENNESLNIKLKFSNSKIGEIHKYIKYKINFYSHKYDDDFILGWLFYSPDTNKEISKIKILKKNLFTAFSRNEYFYLILAKDLKFNKPTLEYLIKSIEDSKDLNDLLIKSLTYRSKTKKDIKPRMIEEIKKQMMIEFLKRNSKKKKLL